MVQFCDKAEIQRIIDLCARDNIWRVNSDILNIIQNSEIHEHVPLDSPLRCVYENVLHEIEDKSCLIKKEWLSNSLDLCEPHTLYYHATTRNMFLVFKDNTMLLLQGLYPRDGSTLPSRWRYFIEQSSFHEKKELCLPEKVYHDILTFYSRNFTSDELLHIIKTLRGKTIVPPYSSN